MNWFHFAGNKDYLYARRDYSGCGIDPQVLKSRREGHWGLTGLREAQEARSRKNDPTCSINSEISKLENFGEAPAGNPPLQKIIVRN
jgi:hypothetical protein